MHAAAHCFDQNNISSVVASHYKLPVYTCVISGCLYKKEAEIELQYHNARFVVPPLLSPMDAIGKLLETGNKKNGMVWNICRVP